VSNPYREPRFQLEKTLKSYMPLWRILAIFLSLTGPVFVYRFIELLQKALHAGERTELYVMTGIATGLSFLSVLVWVSIELDERRLGNKQLDSELLPLHVMLIAGFWPFVLAAVFPVGVVILTWRGICSSTKRFYFWVRTGR
jgi:hypothetical protein